MANSSTVKSPNKSLKQKTSFSKNNLIFFIIIFTVIGGYFIFRSFAAQVEISKVEAEAMTLPTGSAVLANVGASGGQVVKMTQNGSLKGTVTLSSNSNSFTLNAYAQKCRKFWPEVNVLVDGVSILTTSVNGTSLKGFSASGTISAGAHSVEIVNTSASAKNCVTSLIVDDLVFYGEGTTTVPPLSVPSISISPYSQSVGSTAVFTVEVRENSGTATVNAVQASITYPADKVDFISIDGSTSAFTTQAQATGGGGQVTVARGITGSLTGDQLVAKVTFKAKGVISTASINFTTGTALVNSSTNQNIISSLSSTRGAVINITSSTAVLPPRRT